MENFESRRTATLGYQTHYIEAGQGEPLILIHGGGAGADCGGNWSAAGPLLAKRYRTLAYDMVGFGHSDAPDPASFDYNQSARIDQLEAFIEALGLRKVNLVGNSMGGCTALGLAMRRPELVANLVLMGSAGVSHSVGGPIAAIINYDFSVGGMREIVRALTHPDFKPDEAQIAARYALSIQPETRAAYGATMGWVRTNGGLHYPEGDIAKVKTRTLVVNGKNDTVVPVQDAYLFLELLENAAGYIIPHCGHWAMLEHPELFAAVVTQFLEGGEASRP